MRQIMTIADEPSRALIIQRVQKAEIEERVEFIGVARTKDQNKVLWAKLDDISKQVQWYGEWLTAWDWKDVFMAALMKMRVVPGLDGRSFVVLGGHTSTLNKSQFNDLLMVIEVFAAERDVHWTAPQWLEQIAQTQR